MPRGQVGKLLKYGLGFRGLGVQGFRGFGVFGVWGLGLPQDVR